MTTSSAWSALSDPRRRAALDLLLERPRSVGDLVSELGLSQPTTSKHLRVLREAGLVNARVDGPRRLYMIDSRSLAELHAWLDRYRRLWDDRLAALERRLGETAKEEEK